MKPATSKATVHSHPDTTPTKDRVALPVVVAQPPESFGEFAGSGFEGTGRDDMAIPFLSILQGLSPQVKRSDGAYIEGAQEGMLLNTVTNEVFDTTDTVITVIACAYQRAYVEWRVREKGGGFIAEHPVGFEGAQKTERDERGRDILPNGNQLNDTRTFYVQILHEDGTSSPAVLSMTSTQIKKAKQWLMQQNLLRLTANGKAYTPPMFASKWRIETAAESNEKGSWYGWKFTHAGYLAGPNDPVFLEAMAFHKSVVAGSVKADLAKAAAPEGSPAGAGGDVDPADDIPF